MSSTDTLAVPRPQPAAAEHPTGGALAALFRTPNESALTIARITLGLVMFPHGAQKLLGWFGGFGFEGTMGFLTQSIGLPWILGLTVILIEFFGSLALILGFAGRLMALGVAAVMVGAIATTHFANGFFMNWSGALPGEGFEFHLLAIGLALAVIVRGSGAWSVDRVLARVRS
ncbi:MAG: DoxX family protein [Gemmatimonadota bacterium]|nr:DoxX family protein [Gemmatimonadota bacterium]